MKNASSSVSKTGKTKQQKHHAMDEELIADRAAGYWARKPRHGVLLATFPYA